jgi:bifunctional non-homologous end joining protein LigD
VLGIEREERIEYIGRASLGLTQEQLRLLGNNVSSRQGKNPFDIHMPKFKNVNWMESFITCWVSFLEWTNDGGLRHPKIIGFSGATPHEADGKEFIE